MLGVPGPRGFDLNWSALNFQRFELNHLGNPFTEKELLEAIKQSPTDKAPGPDGFTGAFYGACWSIIKGDLVAVMNSLHSQRFLNFDLLNRANIVLVPKQDGAENLASYTPISLIHSVAKLFAKLLSLRLAPSMRDIISKSQTAFIKGRSIHDNFLFVRNLARRYHRNRTPMLLIKLDISKAFDSVRWDYLLALMDQLGFSTRWRNWVAFTLATSTSQVLLNGIPGQPIAHGKGLRQGDPFSPLLFVLAIDPLQRLLHLATEAGILSRVTKAKLRLRTSLYVDDAIIFIKPKKEELESLAALLHLFGEATGLRTNIQKSSVVPIKCEGLNLDEILAGFPASRTNFPIRYLGIPLTVARLKKGSKKVDFQYMIDKARNKLTSWQGRNLTMAGRIVLVKSVLSSQPVHTLSILNVPKEVLEEFDKVRRCFLWAGNENLTGGKCKVNWPTVSRPQDLGGLGILDIHRFARALRLRWLWRQWEDPNAPWAGLGTPCNDTDRLLFAAATRIVIGDGAKTSFWHCAWANGRRPKDIAHDIFIASRGRRCSVREALFDLTWVRHIDLQAIHTADHLKQFVDLWYLTQSVALVHDTEDRIIWRFNAFGTYSTASAYRVQFAGHTGLNLKSLIWKPWGPSKCKTFAWLIIRNRVWTSDRLAARGWPHNPTCQLCRQHPETAHHLIVECRYSRRIWEAIASWLSIAPLDPASWPNSKSVKQWWLMVDSSAVPKKGTCSLLLLIVWQIWLERNTRTFQRRERSVPDLLAAIKEEARMWSLSLVLQRNFGYSRLRITSSTIQSLSIADTRVYTTEVFEEIVIENAPLLERIIPDGFFRIRIIQAPKLKTLGYLYCRDYNGIPMIRPETTVFKKMEPVSINNVIRTVKILALAIPLKLDVVLNFLQCFPRVEKLYLVVLDGWTTQKNGLSYSSLECLDAHLKTLQLTYYHGYRSEVDLIRFFLLNARILETMKLVVKYHDKFDDKWFTSRLYRKLRLHVRASQIAKVVNFEVIDHNPFDSRCSVPANHIHNLALDDPFDRSSHATCQSD
ncbi:hypothetical protein U9M48_040917, partial [Paspalum notatum var. saurae]